ncbi:MarR family winged helix-turn-helix transcriptional regulator [Aestuariispira ectoiniformans]|uniref:MarR family winged helix-turn-helix transcriptional regulator n=1 Tax=Aestuariispira ectoiniformans TaxID=2775080 RepID=UPI00223C4565|nr:MarR family transcriptional regulator [Aestuariispira ectoiniformans]
MSEFSRRHTTEGEALFEMLSELGSSFFKLRASGRTVDAMNDWGSGLWALMYSLQIDGPQTVPALARKRPVARQRIQKIVDELAEKGLVEFTDNPKHKRSKLVQLTGKGHSLTRQQTEQIRDMADILGAGMSHPDMAAATNLLKSLQSRLDNILDN